MDSNNQAYEKAHQLAQTIVATEAYEDYRTAKKQIEQKADLKDQIAQIRSLQMELDCARISGHILPEGQVKTIKTQIEELERDERVAFFFIAEARFIQFFNEIQGIIQRIIEQNF
ncbi:MAG: YlbF family regulator [Syntrophomonas sp.]